MTTWAGWCRTCRKQLGEPYENGAMKEAEVRYHVKQKPSHVAFVGRQVTDRRDP